MPLIYLVEDDVSLNENLSLLLKEEGFEVKSFINCEDALDSLLHLPPDLIITDLKLPGKSGIDLLAEVKESHPYIPVIIITAFATLDNAIQALRLGARDYIKKPFHPEEIILRVKKILNWEKLKEENIWLKKELFKEKFEEIVGRSVKMQEVYKLIEKVSHSDIPVLIVGESGTGKELVARAIHRRSKRREGKFIPVNCGAIPETLMESELFGHEKGAFTGAMERKKGLLEISDGGTLFLDEIGDLSPSVQMKILRFLQDGEFFRVGGTTPVKVDTRIISATNKNLEEEIEKGRFRKDLFYRIQAVTIYLPPLRERREDIPLLIDHFINKYKFEIGGNQKRFSPDALELLMNYEWPGNVRELENVVRACLVLSEGEVIHKDILPQKIREKEIKGKDMETIKELLKEKEREYIIKILQQTKGNVTKASKIAGISRRHFYKKLKDLNIYPKHWREKKE